MNDTTIGEKNVRDEACKVPRDVIRPLDLGASRYIAVSEEANLAALINLSLTHCEGYSTRRTSLYTEKERVRQIYRVLCRVYEFLDQFGID